VASEAPQPPLLDSGEASIAKSSDGHFWAEAEVDGHPVRFLVDTGATAKLVREMLPRAHFATVYAKPLGRPMVDTFITEVSQDTWIYFPWDTGLAFQPPINEAGL